MRIVLLELVAVGVVTASCRAGPPREATCLSVGDVVQLTGVLRDSATYGPPGLGEHPGTDPTWAVPMLRLTPAATVCGAADSSRALAQRLNEVELGLANSQSPHLPAAGTSVAVYGRLESRTVSTQLSDPVLVVDSIAVQHVAP